MPSSKIFKKKLYRYIIQDRSLDEIRQGKEQRVYHVTTGEKNIHVNLTKWDSENMIKHTVWVQSSRRAIWETSTPNEWGQCSKVEKLRFHLHRQIQRNFSRITFFIWDQCICYHNSIDYRLDYVITSWGGVVIWGRHLISGATYS